MIACPLFASELLGVGDTSPESTVVLLLSAFGLGTLPPQMSLTTSVSHRQDLESRGHRTSADLIQELKGSESKVPPGFGARETAWATVLFSDMETIRRRFAYLGNEMVFLLTNH